MSSYKVNKAAVTQARKLIDDGKVDTSTEWSTAAPSADDEKRLIERDGYDAYGAWHLAVDPTRRRTPRAATGSRTAT